MDQGNATGSRAAEIVTPAKMDAALKAKWVEALRNGKFKQARKALLQTSLAGGASYCCIGVGYVACIRNTITFGDDTYHAAAELGLPADVTEDLIEMNDKKGKSFPEIADYIEKNL
jgi:hypothetical protein